MTTTMLYWLRRKHTYRATFILDEEGMVFHQASNFFPVGRNVAEFLRLIDAYAHNQKFGEFVQQTVKKGKMP